MIHFHVGGLDLFQSLLGSYLERLQAFRYAIVSHTESISICRPMMSFQRLEGIKGMMQCLNPVCYQFHSVQEEMYQPWSPPCLKFTFNPPTGSAGSVVLPYYKRLTKEESPGNLATKTESSSSSNAYSVLSSNGLLHKNHVYILQ